MAKFTRHQKQDNTFYYVRADKLEEVHDPELSKIAGHSVKSVKTYTAAEVKRQGGEIAESAGQVTCTSESVRPTKSQPDAKVIKFTADVACVESYVTLGHSRAVAARLANAEYLLTEMQRAELPVTETDRLVNNLLTPTTPLDWTKI
jgi:hypothetical protein